MVTSAVLSDLAPPAIFFTEELLALTYGLDKLRKRVHECKNIVLFVCGHSKFCAIIIIMG